MISFIDKFKELKPMTPELEEEISSKISVIHKKKGEFLYKENQIPSSIYLIRKGCLRTFYYRREKEKNTLFIFENISFSSSASVFLNQPATENAQFLEDSTVESILQKDLFELYEKYPDMETYRRKITEEYCLLLEEKIKLLENTALNKYKIILEKYPEILQRVSLHHIASLLNISKETLSRIRGSIRF